MAIKTKQNTIAGRERDFMAEETETYRIDFSAIKLYFKNTF